MIQRFALISKQKSFWWAAAIGSVIGLSLASFFLPGGDDLYRYYIPFASGCLDCGFVPYYAQWFLSPLLLLPDYPLAWPAWTIISLTGFLALVYWADINPFLFLIAFPFLGQVWLGQVDVVVCTGVILFVFARNPYWRGIGMSLALTKPQLTGIAILFTLLLEQPKTLLKLFLPTIVVFLLSLMVYGSRWPVSWLSNAFTGLPVHAWRLAGMDIWRYGLVLLPIPLLFYDRKERTLAGLIVTAVATPFFGVYSYIVFLIFGMKWWHVLFSYLWLIVYPWQSENAMRFAWVLPLAMLIEIIWNKWQSRQRAKIAA